MLPKPAVELWVVAYNVYRDNMQLQSFLFRAVFLLAVFHTGNGHVYVSAVYCSWWKTRIKHPSSEIYFYKHMTVITLGET